MNTGVLRCQTLAAVAMRYYDSDIYVRTAYETDKFVGRRRKAFEAYKKRPGAKLPAFSTISRIKFWLL